MTNLLTNPTFAGNITGWAGGTRGVSPPVLAYDASLSATVDGSGALKADIPGQGQISDVVWSALIAVTVGGRYRFRASVRVDDGTLKAGLRIDWYDVETSNVDTSKTYAGSTPTTEPSGAGVWASLDLGGAGGLEVPEDAATVKLSVVFNGTTAHAWLDNVIFEAIAPPAGGASADRRRQARRAARRGR